MPLGIRRDVGLTRGEGLPIIRRLMVPRVIKCACHAAPGTDSVVQAGWPVRGRFRRCIGSGSTRSPFQARGFPVRTIQLQRGRCISAGTRRKAATRRCPGLSPQGDWACRTGRLAAAAVLAVLAATWFPAISVTAGADWSFPLPAFPEPDPGDGLDSSGGSAPFPPDFASPEYPATHSRETAGRSAERDAEGITTSSPGATVRPLPPPQSADIARRPPVAGFATVDWQSEDGPFFAPDPTSPISGRTPIGEDAVGEVEGEVTGVVERHFPSGRSSADRGEDSNYRLVVQEPPPGPLRRWLKGRSAPPESPEFWRSWLEEPISGGMAVGYFQGTALIDDWVQEKAGLVGTGRLGWDFAPNLGVETRLSFGSLELSDSFAAVAARWAADTAAGLSETDPLRRRFTDRNATTFQWDVSLLYYPTDYHPARFYLLWGAGLTRMDFTDRFGESYEGTYFTMPVGFGIKFRRLTDPVFRLEFTDNIVFPSRFNVTHHLALTAGLEFRWGGPRRRYWPWNPGY